MDAQQLEALILRVLERIRDDLTSVAPLPEAYVLLPENWRTHSQSRCLKTLQALQSSYRTVAVLPDREKTDLPFSAPVRVVLRSEAECPEDEFVTIFPTAYRGRVVKTALCMQDDFETEWIARCIALGQPVYMPKESPLFTGMEPDAYRQKIEAYYRDAEAFGIKFDRLPPEHRALQSPALSAGTAPKRIITTEDLKGLHGARQLRLRSGDVVTALAAEHAEELGIGILYEQQ